jgi:hypothetical protein
MGKITLKFIIVMCQIICHVDLNNIGNQGGTEPIGK